MTKVISIRHQGNLANRMIQYMAALALSDRTHGSVITGVDLAEWNIPHIENPDTDGFEETLSLSAAVAGGMSLHDIASVANNAASINLLVDGYMQRMAFLDAPSRYRDVFPPRMSPDVAVDELLIHIRGGDIFAGVVHYPLLPTAYFRWLAQKTGLRPVFCGQMNDSPYIRAIRRDFADARFLESGSPIEDFQRIRSARHIAISVSTFSWLASWLSHAETIFLPLCGFLSPAYIPEIDLLPISDRRYRFIQFPLFFGVEEHEMLAQHHRLESTWKEISPRQVALLRDAAPFLTPRTEDMPFDPIWYAHTYIDAAKEISEGWFRDPLHHYLEVGRLRGYHPTHAASGLVTARLPGLNLALHGKASQSSVSAWSQAPTAETDAAIAINGRVWEDKFFHTDNDPSPWWCVDLRETCLVSRIRIFNREGPDAIQKRAAPLVIEASLDADRWRLLFQTDADQIFGGRTGKPLFWAAPAPVQARFVKITLPRQEFLHLAEVEIYGTTAGLGP